MVSKTGIVKRPISEIPVSKMASIACEKALENSKTKADEIDLIILATSTPDMLIPCTASLVQREIKAYKAAAFDLNNACSGFIFALDIASKYLDTGTYKKILVVGSDWASKITNQNDRNTVVFFADGAGAVVVSSGDEYSKVLSSCLNSYGKYESIYIPKGGCLKRFPEKEEEKNKFYLEMNGKEIWDFATDVFPKTIDELCEKAKIKKSEIDWVIPHQANKRIIEESMKTCNISIEKAIINIENRGNTIAATIPLALDEANKENKIKRGQIVALVGFGAGLSWGGILLKY